MSTTDHDFGLSDIATKSSSTRGRFFHEEDDSHRSCFQRDRDRIVRCGAFRRMEHKTQVFLSYFVGCYRTRMTHSLEVAQIARNICRRFGLNQDLAEAVSLAHDIGHPPFGHSGEFALRDATKDGYVFDHNVQAVRILTELENKYFGFNGLNLTWEVLEGLAKHNGPLRGPYATGKHCVNELLFDAEEKYSLKLDEFSGLEAQISSISDDIAYNNHDIDDGLRANLFSIEDLFAVPVIGDIFKQSAGRGRHQDLSRVVHESLRKITNLMVEDVISEISKELISNHISSVEDVRAMDRALVHFSDEIACCVREINSFLLENVYRHYKVNRVSSKAQKVVKDLYGYFFDLGNSLPPEWSSRFVDAEDYKSRSLVVSDFIAGMTDRSVVQEYRRIFDVFYEYEIYDFVL